MTATELDPELRRLIDARLDVIDRTLVSAEVPWSERRSIIGEVETQVFELLARRGHVPTQESVREVLDSLDPPESYLPEELRAPAAAAQRRLDWERAVTLVNRFGSAALCAVGVLIVNGVVVMIIAASGGVIPWIVTLAFLAWLNYAALRRFRTWSAARHGHLLEDLRHSLAAWLVPKNGAPVT